MAAPTYSLKAVVLRRTKLGEADVICTLLAEDGSQVRAVAKGARKPTSSFASRLEVFSVCDLLLVKGKSLDIVKEARLVNANAHLRSDIALMEAASPMAELLDRASQENLPVPKLFAMTCAALEALQQVQPEDASVLTSAFLLKALALIGFLPRFDACVSCGTQIDLTQQPQRIAFSLTDGGVVCDGCLARTETMWLNRDTATWARALLYSTFKEVSAFAVPQDVQLELLRFLQMWIRQHLACSLKSLSFLVGELHG